MKAILTFCLVILLRPLGSGAQGAVFRNSFFSVSIDSTRGLFQIASSSGEVLISSVIPIATLILPSTGDTLEIVGGTWNWKYFPQTTTLELKDSNAYYKNTITVLLNLQSEELFFQCRIQFQNDVEVIRLALLMQADQPLREVYRKNSLADRDFFQEEYWLGKEGALFGSGSNTLLLYHAPGISSLQLSPLKNQLLVNLDYGPDHPYQYFPQRDSLRHEKADLSNSLFHPGDSLLRNFSIHAGKPIAYVPRLMQNPFGFLSALVFTEHAEWTDIRTHRAVYFGSEKITSYKKATGGFIKHGIPVTKSVFYSNPDKVVNSDSRHKTIYTTPIASIRETKGFFEFLQQLSKNGNEICLHTPDQYTASRPLIEEACSFMKKNFNSVTWIDHGYNNGPKNNREAFVCDGLNPASASYAGDIWKKYGLRYFWNPYYEDFATPDSAFFDFNGSLMHPYPGFGDAAPTPRYWQHPTRTGNFYSWPTRDLLEMPDPESWNYHFSTQRLEDFCRQRSIKFEHCYPAGSVENTGFWRRNGKNEVEIQPQFESTLERLASFRNKGLINLTTVRALLDYWVGCEKIRFEYIDSRTIKIINENSFEVKGVSFAVKARVVEATKPFQQKNADGDVIFWFDLKGGEEAVFTFVE